MNLSKEYDSKSNTFPENLRFIGSYNLSKMIIADL